MTQIYKHYLIIARLVAKRARLIRLCEMYPANPTYNAQLIDTSKELMRHQTEEEVSITEEDLRIILNTFYGE